MAIVWTMRESGRDQNPKAVIQFAIQQIWRTKIDGRQAGKISVLIYPGDTPADPEKVISIIAEGRGFKMYDRCAKHGDPCNVADAKAYVEKEIRRIYGVS